MNYKIVLADDHQFLLDGIAAVIKDIPSATIVATAQDGSDLMQEVEKHQPHLVILDLNMPRFDGLQCLQKIKTSFVETKVLVLTNYNQPELVEEVRNQNADGFMVKNSSAMELVEAITKILAGEKYYPAPRQLSNLSEDSPFFDDFLKKHQLTRREVTVIQMICQGMSSKEVANQLNLSELTINTHRRNILRKLDINNVAGLMNFAKQNQLL